MYSMLCNGIDQVLYVAGGEGVAKGSSCSFVRLPGIEEVD